MVYIPLAVLILVSLRRTGYGRMLYAIGDNLIAARLSGARLAGPGRAVRDLRRDGGHRRVPAVRRDERGQRDPCRSLLLPSVAAGGHRRHLDLGGRGGYGGTIVGALILAVISALLTALGQPEAVRQILYGTIIVVVAAAYTRVTGET